MSDTFAFEKAFARLEEILAHMNSGELSLEASLKLYEEADTLIRSSARALNKAEQKIETLVKNRQGELECDGEGVPLVDPLQETR